MTPRKRTYIPLDSRIEKRLERSAFSKRRFLPQDAFEKLLTRGNIQKELKENGIDNEELLDFIVERGRKIFAILVRSSLVKHVSTLQEHLITDRYLPVEQDGSQVTSLSGPSMDDPALDWFRTWRSEAVSSYSDSSNDEDLSDEADISSDDECIHGGVDKSEIRKFCEAQWLFLSPVFTKESIMEELHQDCPLPFLEYDAKTGGGYSTLYEGVIHQAHQTVLIEVSVHLSFFM